MTTWSKEGTRHILRREIKRPQGQVCAQVMNSTHPDIVLASNFHKVLQMAHFVGSWHVFLKISIHVNDTMWSGLSDLGAKPTESKPCRRRENR